MDPPPRPSPNGALNPQLQNEPSRESLTARQLPEMTLSTGDETSLTAAPPPIPHYLDATGRALHRFSVEGVGISTLKPISVPLQSTFPPCLDFSILILLAQIPLISMPKLFKRHVYLALCIDPEKRKISSSFRSTTRKRLIG
jgi:hypothetical protein